MNKSMLKLIFLKIKKNKKLLLSCSIVINNTKSNTKIMRKKIVNL